MNDLYINKPVSETKVVVAMSGGVDSSVVAALLHERGYEVIGVTMQLYDNGDVAPKKGSCCAGQDIYDAKNVADKLGIPHYVLNYESIFKNSVIDQFADSYVNGETPIPCVMCNQTVKFVDLVKMAKDLGADTLATGHYVQKKPLADGGFAMLRGANHEKDQSYYLFSMLKEQLEFVSFPLGGMTKEETRKHAERFGLEVADKPDSQDICFVGGGSYADVVRKLRPEAFVEGDILNVKGEKVGTHQGIALYTIGQRKGVGGGFKEPHYVVKIDAENNAVIVGTKDDLKKQSFLMKNVNWLGYENVQGKKIDSFVKIRSLHEGNSAMIEFLKGSEAKVTFNEPVKSIAPGQACVIYDGERILGGGWITREIF